MFHKNTRLIGIRNRQIVWHSALAVIVALLLAQSAQAALIKLQMVYVQAPPQQVDTDGDGQLDPFSADFVVNNDGTASGTIRLNKANNVTLKRGIIEWTGDEEKAVLTGIHSQEVNGRWQEIGSVQVEVKPAGRPAGGGGGIIIDYDIIDAASHSTSFQAAGVWQRNYVAGLTAPAAQVDTDGDGELDSFAADFMIFNNGLATGTVQLDNDSQIVVEGGATYCLDGETAVVVYGAQYQEIDGTLQKVGESRAQARPAGSGGGVIIEFDIVDAANHSTSFQAPGQLQTIIDPCAD